MKKLSSIDILKIGNAFQKFKKSRLDMFGLMYNWISPAFTNDMRYFCMPIEKNIIKFFENNNIDINLNDKFCNFTFHIIEKPTAGYMMSINIHSSPGFYYIPYINMQEPQTSHVINFDHLIDDEGNIRRTPSYDGTSDKSVPSYPKCSFSLYDTCSIFECKMNKQTHTFEYGNYLIYIHYSKACEKCCCNKGLITDLYKQIFDVDV